MILPLFAATSTIIKLDVKGAIGPATSNYLKDGVSLATSQHAQMILIKLDTPGGLSTSMREMIQEILNSPIPVVTYVYPKGARSASAGTYLLYASHVAAMAPGTNLGAATPINLMPSSKISDSNSSAIPTLEKKVINDSAAYIKSLAELNDRNASWAQEAVREAKSISAEDALKLGVIDLMASDTKELLSKLDGRVVNVSDQNVTLKTEGAIMHNFEPDWNTRFLSIVTDPNIAYIFLLIAIYGVFFELMNPGAIIPGVIGLISGVVALYSLNMIPFNYAGLLLIVLGVSFMVAEVFISGFGILGIGGVVAFGFGSLLLFDAQTLGSDISLSLVIAFSLVSFAFFILVMSVFVKSRSAKVVTGMEEMLGTVAEVVESNKNGYIVHCHGETWSATSKEKLTVGQRVQVVELSGLILRIKPTEE